MRLLGRRQCGEAHVIQQSVAAVATTATAVGHTAAAAAGGQRDGLNLEWLVAHTMHYMHQPPRVISATAAASKNRVTTDLAAVLVDREIACMLRPTIQSLS